MSTFPQSTVDKIDNLSLEPDVKDSELKHKKFNNASQNQMSQIEKEKLASGENSNKSQISTNNQTSDESERSSKNPLTRRPRRMTSPDYDLHGRCRKAVDDLIPSKSRAESGAEDAGSPSLNHVEHYLQEFDAGVEQLARWANQMKNLQQQDPIGFRKAVADRRSRAGECPLGGWIWRIQAMERTIRDVKHENRK